MNRTATTGSGLAALIFLSVWMRTFFPGLAIAPATTSAGTARTTAAAVQAPDQLADGPWRASQEFFAGQGTECPGKGAPTIPRRDKWCIPDKERVRALIAIAPDPVATHMALAFDRVLEAIQLAAEQAGYVMDRYWLPWRVPVASGGAAPASESAPAAGRQLGTEPGVLLFRRNAGPRYSEPSMLVVFLAADTATSGIDGAQFTKAVNYVDEVMGPFESDAHECDVPSCPKARTIDVIGPTFSGSLASLRRLTDANATHDFVAYSGTVSSVCAAAEQGLLAQWPTPLCPGGPEDYTKAPNVTFRMFVHPAESAFKRFVLTTYPVPARDCTRPQVAILSETATTFGHVARTGGDRDKDGRTRPATPGDVQACITSFAFPREIASLRNASRAAASAAQAAPQVPGGKSQFLPLDLTDRTNIGDAPPDYSLQGPLSKEAVLMNIAAGLRRGHYRYIGLIGSNVLDVLFLTDLMRAVCPDSRLFLMGGDLLFERQFDNVPYIGTIALTTYPLTDRTLQRDGSGWGETSPHLPVSDGYEQGEYEAALEMIKKVLESSAARPEPATGEAALQGQPDAPDDLPLWMMVVGDGGYWPVRLLAGASDEQSRLALGPTDFTGTWQLLVIFLSAVALFHIAVLLTASPFAPQFRDFALVAAAPVQRLFFIQVACATLALGLLLLLMPAWRYAEGTSGFEFGGSVALVGVCAVALFTEVLACLRWWSRKQSDTKAPEATDRTLRLHGWLFGLVWIPTAIAAYEWWRLLGASPETLYGFFLAYRAVHPLSGVSPVTPMIPLLAAVYTWTLFEIWRLRFSDTLRPRLLQSQTQPDATGASVRSRYPGADTEPKVVHAIKEYRLGGGYVAVFVVAFLVWLLSFHPRDPFVLFEGGRFAALYAVMFCLVVALMLSAGLRMLQIWAGLRRLLAELERSRLRGAFERLKERSWSFWRQGGEDAEWTYMARSIEAADRLRKTDVMVYTGPGGADLSTAASAIQCNVRDVREQVVDFRSKSKPFAAMRSFFEFLRPPGQPETDAASPRATNRTGIERARRLETAVEKLQESLAVALGRTLDVLYSRWSHDSAPPDDAEVGDDGKAKVTPEARALAHLEEYVALRYVAFIRGALGHLRHVMIFVAVSFSLVLISLNVYSFEPHRSLIWSFTAIFILTGYMVVRVLMQLHRDPIMSRITNTSANSLDLHFYLRIVAFGAVPLLTLVATNFPSIGRYLVSFLGPSLEALK